MILLLHHPRGAVVQMAQILQFPVTGLFSRNVDNEQVVETY